MAGDVGDRRRGLDAGLSKEVQEELGILAVPVEQYALDYLGGGRWRVRAHYPAALPCRLKYQRSY